MIQAAGDPAAESWRNINAIDDLVQAILTNTGQLTVAALAGNAAAGGLMLALAADQVWCRAGAVLNPHYRLMGLHGSEYWTYTLPRRVGADEAARLTQACLPVTPASALRTGLVNRVIAGDPAGFRAQVTALAGQLAASPDYAGAAGREGTAARRGRETTAAGRLPRRRTGHHEPQFRRAVRAVPAAAPGLRVQGKAAAHPAPPGPAPDPPAALPPPAIPVPGDHRGPLTCPLTVTGHRASHSAGEYLAAEEAQDLRHEQLRRLIESLMPATREFRHGCRGEGGGTRAADRSSSAVAAQRQLEGPGARGPGQVEVVRVRVTVPVQADLVELGEAVVVARHDGVQLGDADLVGEDPDIGRLRRPLSRMSTGSPVRRLRPHPNDVPISRVPSWRV